MQLNWLKIMLAIGVTLVLILAIVFWWLLSSVSNGYEVDEGKVYFRSFNNQTWKIDRRQVDGANADTIKAIGSSGGLYATDGKTVFFQETSITAADPNTFRILNWREELSRDANHVYWKSQSISDDPDNFKILTRGYSKDSKHVYYASWIVEEADPATFVVTGTVTSQAHDANHQFNMGRKIESREPR